MCSNNGDSCDNGKVVELMFYDRRDQVNDVVMSLNARMNAQQLMCLLANALICFRKPCLRSAKTTRCVKNV